jgi:hypothetical protein
MSNNPEGAGVNISVGGDLSGQVGVGSHIQQVKHTEAGNFSAQDRQDLDALLDALTQQVETRSPDDVKATAMQRARELREAVAGGRPDLSTLEYVRNWLVRHVPQVAGAVTGLIFHPLIGKLVEAAGDGLVAEFRRRFGDPPASP